MSHQRRRYNHTQIFEQLLAEEAARFRKAAEETRPGFARKLLMKRARQAETASHMSDWLRSSGLQHLK